MVPQENEVQKNSICQYSQSKWQTKCCESSQNTQQHQLNCTLVLIVRENDSKAEIIWKRK